MRKETKDFCLVLLVVGILFTVGIVINIKYPLSSLSEERQMEGFVEDIEFVSTGGLISNSYTIIRFEDGTTLKLSYFIEEIPLNKNVQIYYEYHKNTCENIFEKVEIIE